MELRLFKLAVLLSLVCFTGTALAGTVTRPTKTFGGSSFINGVVPQASDFNGDTDTIYSEFNGNIDNANIKVAAAISASKINADGFTVNVRTTNVAPCDYLDETDQASDLKRWGICSVAGVFKIGTYSDANVLQNQWFTLARADGSFNLGSTSGTNVVNGATTFNQSVTFAGSVSPSFNVPTGGVTLYMGNTAPAGWLLMDGASSSCTGASSVNAPLCIQLVSLYATNSNYKGAGTTVTSDFTTDEIVHTAHGKAANDRVHFSTTTTLPAPLSAATVYCIISVTTDRYKVGTTCGGVVTDLTTNGTGTHTDYFNFITPDSRGRSPLGTGQVTTVESIVSVTAAANAVAIVSNDSKWVTGMPVTVSGASGFTGLVNGSFWIVRVSSTTISIASSLLNAQNGTVVTVTGTGSATFTYTGSSRSIGQVGGEEAHAESSTEQLAHTHTSSFNPGVGAIASGAGVGSQGTTATSSTGGNAAMNILSPYFIMTYIIKL